jgi:hypothetical protein
MAVSAIIAVLILGLLVAFQVALIVGAPFGHFAWGGKSRILPTKLRTASLSSILIYVLLMAFILSKAELWTLITDETILQVGLWIMTGYLFLNVLMNAISRSKPERYTMTPVALILAVLFLIVTIP